MLLLLCNDKPVPLTLHFVHRMQVVMFERGSNFSVTKRVTLKKNGQFVVKVRKGGKGEGGEGGIYVNDYQN